MKTSFETGVMFAVVAVAGDDFLTGEVALGLVSSVDGMVALAKEGVVAAPPQSAFEQALESLTAAVSSGRPVPREAWNLPEETEGPCVSGCLTHRRYEVRSFTGEVLASWWPEYGCSEIPKWSVDRQDWRVVTSSGGVSIGVSGPPALS